MENCEKRYASCESVQVWILTTRSFIRKFTLNRHRKTHRHGDESSNNGYGSEGTDTLVAPSHVHSLPQLESENKQSNIEMGFYTNNISESNWGYSNCNTDTFYNNVGGDFSQDQLGYFGDFPNYGKALPIEPRNSTHIWRQITLGYRKFIHRNLLVVW